MNLLHTAHVPGGPGPFPTVVTLHGWGANAHDLLALAPLFPSGILTLCPQGQTRLSVAPGMDGYGWFPLIPGEPPNARAFLEASTSLRDFVDQASERYPIDPERRVALGFSQGGTMAYDLVLRSADRFAGLIALSSWLPDLLLANLPQNDAQKGLPVLVLHGTEDAQIDISRARESRDRLNELGVDLTYHEFPMGHEIKPEALSTLVQWLRDTLARDNTLSGDRARR